MPEMAHIGKRHGEARLVGGFDHVFVFDGSARLDDGGYTRLGGGQQPVGEGEERIGRAY